MHAAIAMPGNTAATFLVHFFGSGFEDERYVVERFQALADGDIRRMPGDEPAKRGRKAKCVTATLKTVKEKGRVPGRPGGGRARTGRGPVRVKG